MKEIPIERATELFEYNEDSGVLTLKRTRVGSLTRKGDIIGTKDSRGHLQVKIDGVLYQVHRVCYAMHTGVNTDLEIDHIDRNRTNNKFSNLREVTRAQNNANTGPRSTNSLGVKNIVIEGNKFRVDIDRVYCGSFYSLHEAITVANLKRLEHYGEYAFQETLSTIDDIDNTPAFKIAGIEEECMNEVVELGVSSAIDKFKISRASFYRIKNHVIRQVETNEPIPQDILDARAEARTQIVKEENANVK